MPKTKSLFAILLLSLVVAEPLGAADSALISIDYVKNGSMDSNTGSLSVNFLDETGHTITKAVGRQGYFHWALKRNGTTVDASLSLATSYYDFVLNYGGRLHRRSVEIKSDRTTVISIRPGSVHVTSGPYAQEPTKIRLIFTRVPELTAKQFRREGCREVTPNLALIVEFQASVAPTTLYLPDGLYRVITQYDGRLKAGDSFLRVDRARRQSVELGDHGLTADPVATPPVFAGKCYY